MVEHAIMVSVTVWMVTQEIFAKHKVTSATMTLIAVIEVIAVTEFVNVLVDSLETNAKISNVEIRMIVIDKELVLMADAIAIELGLE